MRFLLAPLVLFTSLLSAAEKPNIVYILADDLGYGDLGCFGQKTLTTPHIDQMAAEGMKFTRHYSGSTVCGPSRCVLLTGLHTGHCSIRGNQPSQMPDDDLTVAEMLKDAGYVTGGFGKWGVSNPPPQDEPNRQGFDEFYGYVNMFHAHNFYPEFLIRNGEIEPLNNIVAEKWKTGDGAMGGSKEGVGVAEKKVDYAPDLITDEALNFLKTQAADESTPFFLYYALNIPHANNEGGRPPQNDGMEVPDYGEFADKDWPNPEKGFATMIRKIDNDVGRILSVLREAGVAENTLVIFSSDNGPHEEGQHKMEYFDSNGALRGLKRDLYEGGVRVPTIAWWPGTVAAGSQTDLLSGFQDFLPTVAELSGQPVPEKTDGVSLVPTLSGTGDQAKHDFLYWEFSEKGGRVGVVTDRWKAVRYNQLKDPKAPVQLYDLKKDLSETEDVASAHPDVVAELQALMELSHTEP